MQYQPKTQFLEPFASTEDRTVSCSLTGFPVSSLLEWSLFQSLQASREPTIEGGQCDPQAAKPGIPTQTKMEEVIMAFSLTEAGPGTTGDLM